MSRVPVVDDAASSSPRAVSPNNLVGVNGAMRAGAGRRTVSRRVGARSTVEGREGFEAVLCGEERRRWRSGEDAASENWRFYGGLSSWYFPPSSTLGGIGSSSARLSPSWVRFISTRCPGYGWTT